MTAGDANGSDVNGNDARDVNGNDARDVSGDDASDVNGSDVNGNDASGAGGARTRGRELIADAVGARRRAQMVAGLRGMARTRPAQGAAGGSAEGGAGATGGGERCDICQTTIPADHRHLLQLVERRIECVCESCWARHSGDVEYRPTGGRTLWLADLQLPDDVWASFQIPIGLTFLMQSSTAGCVVALYPSPAGATESELHFSSWAQMVELNPILAQLEADVEGLIVNRLAEPAEYVIAPIDRCYELTGAVRASWQGLSGGPRVEEAVASFFADLRARAMSA